MRMHHIVTFGLTGSTKFLHIVSQKHDYEKKNIEHEIYFDLS